MSKSPPPSESVSLHPCWGGGRVPLKVLTNTATIVPAALCRRFSVVYGEWEGLTPWLARCAHICHATLARARPLFELSRHPLCWNLPRRNMFVLRFVEMRSDLQMINLSGPLHRICRVLIAIKLRLTLWLPIKEDQEKLVDHFTLKFIFMK